MTKIICAGLGPGDPELLSVRAHKAVTTARCVAYFRKKGRPGVGRRIVEGLLRPDCVEHPMEYPLTTEIPVSDRAYGQALNGFYDAWAARLCELANRDDVVVLCEGDPFFYGSFVHLFVRLRGRIALEVIPGIPGMVGCWNAAELPLTWGDDVATVAMGTLDEDALLKRMTGADAVVIMKTGRNLPKIRRALRRAGRLAEAWLVVRGTMPDQLIERLADVDADDCPYFATVLVAGKGRRSGMTP
jgi:precorrin-2/cobalt-factor-2 C20-methyltransferase